VKVNMSPACLDATMEVYRVVEVKLVAQDMEILRLRMRPWFSLMSWHQFKKCY
jgi:hypothetical protein